MDPTSPAPSIAELDNRPALSNELLFLLEKHPRDVWTGPAALGMTAQFWLDRHGAFRQLGESLKAAVEELRHGRIAAEAFAPLFARRLQVFLGELNGHHQIEDHHYFPRFREAEPRLSPGFELLDRDHHILHARLLATAEAANTLLQALARDPIAAARGPLEHYAEVSEELVAGMLRHLDDEEDLVIPLLIERGELDA